MRNHGVLGGKLWVSWQETASVLAVIVLLLAGCISLKNAETGTPFLSTDGTTPEAALRDLAQKILKDAPDLVAVQALLLSPGYAKWTGAWDRRVGVERYTWRFVHVRTKKYGLAISQGAEVETRGYQLVVGFVNGTVADVQTEVTDLTDQEREWTTTHVISLGAAVVGTLFMLHAQ